MTSGSGDRSFSWNDAAPLVRSRARLLSALSVCVRITDYYYYYFFFCSGFCGADHSWHMAHIPPP